MRGLAKILLVLPLLAAAGCTETKFLDTIGAGKSSPDETAIQPNRQLVMPPDLNLRAPANADQEVAAKTAGEMPTDPAAPAGLVSAEPQQGQDNSPIVPGTNMTFQQQQDQIYAKYGISKVKPDGTPKTLEELSEEVRVAAVEEKRRANPKYGTFWNWAELFKE